MRWIVSFLLFSSCIPNNSLETYAQSQQNTDNLMRLVGGMKAEEVMHIMHPPYRIETFQVGEDSYEAWFYITRVTVLGQDKPIHRNMTPLILRDGILLGRGYDYYRWVIRQEEEYKNQKKIGLEPKKESHTEDRALEKALDVTMSKASPKEPEPEDDKEELPIKPEDEDRIEEESEQNFDYW